MESLAASGHALADIARHLGISKSSLSEMRKRDEQVAAALERGRARLETELTGLLLAKARKGDTVSLLFALKCLCGWRETGPADTGPKVNVQINLPAAMSEADYTKLIDALPVNDAPKEPDDA